MFRGLCSNIRSVWPHVMPLLESELFYFIYVFLILFFSRKKKKKKKSDCLFRCPLAGGLYICPPPYLLAIGPSLINIINYLINMEKLVYRIIELAVKKPLPSSNHFII